jgi:hypothetical protein
VAGYGCDGLICCVCSAADHSAQYPRMSVHSSSDVLLFTGTGAAYPLQCRKPLVTIASKRLEVLMRETCLPRSNTGCQVIAISAHPVQAVLG